MLKYCELKLLHAACMDLGKKMKLVFEWCKECDLFKKCYCNNWNGPAFLEPACAEGPYKESEPK